MDGDGRSRTPDDPGDAAALAALDDPAHIRLTLENNAAGAQWLTTQLSQLGFEAGATWANFLYIDIGQDAGPVADQLEQAGVIVRPLAVWGAPNAIRVTIGTPDENERFVAALKNTVRGSLRIRS